MKEKISITMSESIIKKVDSIVDRLFVRNRSQAIEVLLKNSFDKNKTAVILLGGPEKELKIGKEFVPCIKIGGISLIERNIRKLRENNFRKIFIIARKNIIEKIFSIVKNGSSYGISIKYIEETESKGSADSLRLLKNQISDFFLVIFGDIIFDKIKIGDVWHSHLQNNPIATLTLVTFNNPSIKGEVFLEGNKIVKFNQKPKDNESYLVFCPVFVCGPELLHYKGDSLEKDILPRLAKKGVLNGHVSVKSEIHIHSQRDIVRAKKELKDY